MDATNKSKAAETEEFWKRHHAASQPFKPAICFCSECKTKWGDSVAAAAQLARRGEPQPDAQPHDDWPQRDTYPTWKDSVDAFNKLHAEWSKTRRELERANAEHAEAIRQEHAEQVRLIRERDALRAHVDALAAALRNLTSFSFTTQEYQSSLQTFVKLKREGRAALAAYEGSKP